MNITTRHQTYSAATQVQETEHVKYSQLINKQCTKTIPDRHDISNDIDIDTQNIYSNIIYKSLNRHSLTNNMDMNI